MDSSPVCVKIGQDTTGRGEHAGLPTVVRFHSDKVFVQINFGAHFARHGLYRAAEAKFGAQSSSFELCNCKPEKPQHQGLPQVIPSPAAGGSRTPISTLTSHQTGAPCPTLQTPATLGTKPKK